PAGPPALGRVRRPLGGRAGRAARRARGGGRPAAGVAVARRAARPRRALRPRPARAAPAARRNPPPRGRRRLLADPGRGPLARLRTARAEAAGLAAAEDDLVPAVGGPA